MSGNTANTQQQADAPPAGNAAGTNPPLTQVTPPGTQNAPVTTANWLDNDDLNGECFVSGEIGEIEEMRANRVVVFQNDTPHATTPGTETAFTAAQMSSFILINAKAVALSYGVPVSKVHVTVAYYRFLATKLGLISPAFGAAQLHVRYNEAIVEDATGLARINGHAQDAAVLAARLTAAERKSIRLNFSNTVCCVAYMFRVRGHHWLEDMEVKYKNLWKKCLKDGDNPNLEWKLIAHDALHAIIPVILDNYWKICCEEGKIAGALIKRLDSAPAGVAAIRAVYAGSQDLIMAVPGIRDRFTDHFDDLDRLIADMKLNRWAGSINRRYYGAAAIPFDEQRFGAIASVVYKALEAFAANSPLLKSQALKRVADNAPITGGVVARSIATAASDPEVAKGMFIVRGA